MSEIKDMSMVDYINQRELWCAAEGVTPILQMSDGRRALAARWLMTHATPIISLIESAYHESIVAEEGKYTIADVLGLMSHNPRTWMSDTTLYKALVRGLPEAP